MEGNLSIINQWWKPQKGGGKFLNFSGGKQKGGDTIFDLNLVGGEGGGGPGGNYELPLSCIAFGPHYIMS